MQDIRTRLIEATFQEVFSKGYNGASLANILDRANTKKGSMYHYFSSKKEMVLSMIEEKIDKRIKQRWQELENTQNNILELLISMIRDTNSWNLTKGCPLGNLLQESLNEDEDFANTLTQILNKWKQLFSQALKKAIANKEIKPTINTENISTFIIACIQGSLLISKKNQDKIDFYICIDELTFYINSLKK